MHIDEQKILIVTDNPDLVEQMQSALGQKHILLYASSVIDLLHNQDVMHPDLVLLETRPQDTDRCQIDAQILALLQTLLIPVVLIVDSETDEILECLTPGGVDFITRPIRDPILRARVQTLLELKQLHDHYRPTKDCLPNIPNWQDCADIFNREWRRSLRYQTPQSIIVVEIDFFNAYQESLGRAAAENCLRQIACVLVANAKREIDLVSSDGDYLFVIFLPETDTNGALQVAHQIEESIDGIHIAHPRSPVSDHITVGIGLATITPKPKQEPGELISRALALLRDTKLSRYNHIKC